MHPSPILLGHPHSSTDIIEEGKGVWGDRLAPYKALVLIRGCFSFASGHVVFLSTSRCRAGKRFNATFLREASALGDS